MPLSDAACKNTKPKDKPFKLADEKGMFLLVNPNGSKYFRFKYRFAGKEKMLALGVYPDTSLKVAREKRDLAREQIANGIDPSENKKAVKQSAMVAATNSFEIVSREWHSKFKAKWTEKHAGRLLTRLEQDVFPYIGCRPINEIEAPELLQVMRRIEGRGVIDTLHRILQNCGQIFRYGIATGRCSRDPSGDLRGALTPVTSKHHASITDPKQIAELLRAMDDYQGSFVSKCGLKFSVLTFCRPGEIRHAEWVEIDLQAKQWRIPAPKMKMRQQHIVPLSSQALEVLAELQLLTGGGKYLFPCERSTSRPMSENTVNAALRRMGYTKEEMTAHGFRSMASTRLNEMHFNGDCIERQLAHCEKDSVRAAYNYAEYLPERTKMMQSWADYLDGLKNGAQVIAFKKAAK
ncbi:MAG: tyrosine-type recombinase/integrase [Methylovulum sp.]|nr:tyrosine-type recombinase/integrase [Methylovulum sp.]